MADKKSADHRTIVAVDAADGRETGNTLLPMLVAGLVLVIVGAIVVMAFV